jgi:hypothetical protein
VDERRQRCVCDRTTTEGRTECLSRVNASLEGALGTILSCVVCSRSAEEANTALGLYEGRFAVRGVQTSRRMRDGLCSMLLYLNSMTLLVRGKQERHRASGLPPRKKSTWMFAEAHSKLGFGCHLKTVVSRTAALRGNHASHNKQVRTKTPKMDRDAQSILH